MGETQQIFGRIYKITSSQCDGCYIGSTTLPLAKRFSVHKAHYKMHLKGKYNNTSSFDVLKHTDAKIELVEEGFFESKRDLEKREGHYINVTPNTVNKKGAGMTRAETAHKLYDKKKDHLNEKLTCKVCGSTCNRQNTLRHCRTKKHQDALQKLESEEFHTASSSTRTPPSCSDGCLDSDSDDISDESFYQSV
jgi:hypothetical protein